MPELHLRRHVMTRKLTKSAGYKEYKTERTYMARMGDWRDNKDVEIPLDGIGGVNIVVKADVHRAGMWSHRALGHVVWSR